MQFKHPELLWALLLLLIPVLIHLFQLRKFKKTPFTNVKLLQKVISESRKSNTLKKWLLLFTRLAIYACIIIGFAQPFFAKKTALKEKETVIYLDDSFSMQAKNNGSTLLESAVQDVLKAIPNDEKISLFTNEKEFLNVTKKDIQNDLLTLNYTPKQLELNEISLKAKTLLSKNKNTLSNIILISDFQSVNSYNKIDSTLFFVQKKLDNIKNIVIDSVYVDDFVDNNFQLVVNLSSNVNIESVPVSLFNDKKLIAKAAAKFSKNKSSQVTFTIPANQKIDGIVKIEDSGLTYDNTFYFNIEETEKIKVISISEDATDNDYLSRIYSNDEFVFKATTLKTLNYSSIDEQNLIVINELSSIPNSLSQVLKSFYANGGNIVLIPSIKADLTSYNNFMAGLAQIKYGKKINKEHGITNVNFSHSLYKNVFTSKVTNFQYPKVSSYYTINTIIPNVLSFENKAPFLLGNNGLYFFTASISKENSSFKNSPLIVPTLYNIGRNSLALPALYEVIDSSVSIDIPTVVEKDNILKVVKDDYEFIPIQQSFSNKVNLLFRENPTTDGIFYIKKNIDTIKTISFNHLREESNLNYTDIQAIAPNQFKNSITDLFEELNRDNAINALWKWFVIAALLFVCLEVLIQKIIK